MALVYGMEANPKNRVIAAIDFSDVTEAVVEAAVEQTRRLDGELILLHAAAPDPEFVGYEVGPQHERDFRAKLLREEHKKMNELAEELRGRGTQVAAEMIQGGAGEVILREAEDPSVEMVVMGSHGHGALFNLVVGSVANEVLKKSKVPTLVIPSRRKG